MLSQQWGYGLLEYSILEYYRYFCKSCIYDRVNTSYLTLVSNSGLNVEMCHVWGCGMPRQKGALRKILVFPLCLVQEQQLPGVQSRGHRAPQQLGEQSPGRSQAKALVTAQSICSASWRGFGIWALPWAFLRARPVSFSCHPRALGREWRSFVGRALGEGSVLWGIFWGFMSYSKI